MGAAIGRYPLDLPQYAGTQGGHACALHMHAIDAPRNHFSRVPYERARSREAMDGVHIHTHGDMETWRGSPGALGYLEGSGHAWHVVQRQTRTGWYHCPCMHATWYNSSICNDCKCWPSCMASLACMSSCMTSLACMPLEGAGCVSRRSAMSTARSAAQRATVPLCAQRFSGTLPSARP